MGPPAFYIYYHAYLVGNWRSILTQHIDRIKSSGLYDRITKMYIHSVYHDHTKLHELKQFASQHHKIILSNRKFDIDIPWGVNVTTKISPKSRTGLVCDPELQQTRQIGESESIMRMVKDSKKQTQQTLYMFLHTKNVTHLPENEKRYDLCNDTICNRDNTNEILKFIDIWKSFTKNPEAMIKKYYIYDCNIFYTTNKILNNFAVDKFLQFKKKTHPRLIEQFPVYNDYGKFIRFSNIPTDRHVFNNFIKKLFEYIKSYIN